MFLTEGFLGQLFLFRIHKSCKTSIGCDVKTIKNLLDTLHARVSSASYHWPRNIYMVGCIAWDIYSNACVTRLTIANDSRVNSLHSVWTMHLLSQFSLYQAAADGAGTDESKEHVLSRRRWLSICIMETYSSCRISSDNDSQSLRYERLLSLIRIWSII